MKLKIFSQLFEILKRVIIVALLGFWGFTVQNGTFAELDTKKKSPADEEKGSLCSPQI